MDVRINSPHDPEWHGKVGDASPVWEDGTTRMLGYAVSLGIGVPALYPAEELVLEDGVTGENILRLAQRHFGYSYAEVEVALDSLDHELSQWRMFKRLLSNSGQLKLLQAIEGVALHD